MAVGGLSFRWGILTALCILIIGGCLGSPGSAADIWDAIKVSGNQETLITIDDIKIRRNHELWIQLTKLQRLELISTHPCDLKD